MERVQPVPCSVLTQRRGTNNRAHKQYNTHRVGSLLEPGTGTRTQNRLSIRASGVFFNHYTNRLILLARFPAPRPRQGQFGGGALTRPTKRPMKNRPLPPPGSPRPEVRGGGNEGRRRGPDPYNNTTSKKNKGGESDPNWNPHHHHRGVSPHLAQRRDTYLDMGEHHRGGVLGVFFFSGQGPRRGEGQSEGSQETLSPSRPTRPARPRWAAPDGTPFRRAPAPLKAKPKQNVT